RDVAMILYGPEDPPVAIVTIFVSREAASPEDSSPADSSPSAASSPPESSPHAERNNVAPSNIAKYLLNFILLLLYMYLIRSIAEFSFYENANYFNFQIIVCVLSHFKEYSVNQISLTDTVA